MSLGKLYRDTTNVPTFLLTPLYHIYSPTWRYFLRRSDEKVHASWKLQKPPDVRVGLFIDPNLQELP